MTTLTCTILAISGSLRARSANATLLQAATALLPPSVRVVRYTRLGELPHFNPDLDAAPLPGEVTALRAEVAAADALLISSPEYAHGVPGSLKNALDWLVSGPELPAIPFALLSPSPLSEHVGPALIETLRTMSAHLVEEATITIPVSGRPLTAGQILADPALADPLRKAMQALAAVAERSRREGMRLVPVPLPAATSVR